MSFREKFVDYSRGDDLRLFWWFFRRRNRAENRIHKGILTFICNRLARKHGGYVGYGAEIEGTPSMPHGLHGVFISRYAHIGAGCRIYQNVTIGEIDRMAPLIGEGCLIGAGAVIVGGIRIGKHVKIGAGAVVNCDIADYCTVVSQSPRIICNTAETARRGTTEATKKSKTADTGGRTEDDDRTEVDDRAEDDGIS